MNHISTKSIKLFFLNSFTLGIFLFQLPIILLSFWFEKKFNISNMTILFNFITVFILYLLSRYYAKLSWNNYKYELLKDGYLQNTGVFFKNSIYIPYEKIIEVIIHEGPIDRLLGIKTLVIHTISSVSGPNGAALPRAGRIYTNADEAVNLRKEILKNIKSK